MGKTEAERLLAERTEELAFYKAAYDLIKRKLDAIAQIAAEDSENR